LRLSHFIDSGINSKLLKELIFDALSCWFGYAVWVVHNCHRMFVVFVDDAYQEQTD
jgi:hypothetical protein